MSAMGRMRTLIAMFSPPSSGEQQNDLYCNTDNGSKNQKRECSSHSQKPRIFATHATRLAVSPGTAIRGKQTLEPGCLLV